MFILVTLNYQFLLLLPKLLQLVLEETALGLA